MRRVGLLTNLAAEDPEGRARIEALLQGLSELGWREGRSLQIDIRWGADDAPKIQRRMGVEDLQPAHQQDRQAKQVDPVRHPHDCCMSVDPAVCLHCRESVWREG